MRPLSLGPAGAGCYLFPTLAGYLLVDTGCERTAEELLRQLSRRIGLSELQWIFLTHAHADHAVGLEGLLMGPRARVLLHPLGLERLRSGKDPGLGRAPGRWESLVGGLTHLLGQETAAFPPLSRGMENRCIPLEGMRRRELESSLGVRFLDTPGHTADSMSLLTEDGTLFCGDAAMSGPLIRRHRPVSVESLEDCRESWKVLRQSGGRMLYPGHGKPFPLRRLELDQI